MDLKNIHRQMKAYIDRCTVTFSPETHLAVLGMPLRTLRGMCVCIYSWAGRV